ncbi:MAG: Twitching motility protein PilT [Candidatus Ozemobacter sibiricus]|uniref:Twitching motility protein PilT n=1 Tax=Candidatus Ozemobacter sibiricus TaxID=2268124 RepID=A0A367ZQX3_9BACT|nr:MAG: Twitching motility protein PilT [Candidatus Ozemobacter sibiricus]
MIEEILISLQDKLRSSDFLDNETAIDKFGALLQSQNTEKQRKIIGTILPLALSSKFETIQKKVVQVVSNYPTILKDVLPALKLSSDPTVRFWAHYIMIQLDFFARDELLEIAKSKESDEIRMLAMEQLARKPDKQVILCFLERISDPSWIIRRLAKKLLIEQGDGIYQIIQEYFMNCPSRQKYDCIKIIPLILKDKAFALFQRMLESDTKGVVRPYICAGLGEIKTENSLQTLFGMLQDGSMLVREEAIKALTNWGREVVHPLLAIFPSASPETRHCIMILLGRILGLDVTKELNDFFGPPTSETKYYIMTALSQVRDPAVVQDLLPYLRDDSVFIQEHASRILASMGVHALDPLLACLDSEDDKLLLPVLRVIGEIGSKDALRPLLFLIDNSRNTLVRTCAIEAIAKLQKFETVAGLLLLKLDDKDHAIRHTIVENLSKHPRSAFLKDLVLACLDRNADVARGAREILSRRDYPGVPSFFTLFETATDFEKDKIISLASKLSTEQFDSVLKKEKITIEALQPENVETRVHRRRYTKENITDIKELLYFLHEERGSDLHLNIGLPPSIRIHGDLVRTTFETITPEKSRYLLYSLMNDAQKKTFAERMEIDFSFEIPDCARFRANVFMQKNGMSAVFRIIPNVIPTFEELSLDKETMIRVCNHKTGLILVTGATGSGKSTTLAAMIDYINRTRYDHIITIEDPIEFVHPHKRCVITQRELGTNTLSFSNALRSALREDPDVILVGEMRDYETMHLAITAAETGHLVFSTLHTINAYESIHRIIGSFPGDQQHTIRMQLAGSLRGIVSQRLIPAYLSSGRVLAYEVLVATQPIRRCIKEDKIDQIISTMQTSRSDGMITMDMCLEDLVIRKKITYEDGLKNAEDKKEFEKRLTERLGGKATGAVPAAGAASGAGTPPGAQPPGVGKPVISTTPQVKGPAR